MTHPIEFDRLICSDLGAALQREWLETNGLGGFASSTIVGLNTRRYHGLLVAAIKPPASRAVLLSKLDESVWLGGKRFGLSANQYPGAVYPEGYRLLDSFRLDPFPVFTYRIDGLRIEKSVFLVHAETTAVVQYELFGDLSGRSAVLEVRTLIAFRDFHNLTHANPYIRGDVTVSEGLATIAPYDGLPTLNFAHNAESIDTAGFWFYNFEYVRERERGLEAVEDLYSPFLLRFNLADSATATVIASTELHAVSEASELKWAEIERRDKIRASAAAEDEFAGLLFQAADQFLVSRGRFNSVIAGYPWFSDWGRDTMISLPGLTLVTGRFDVARAILKAYAHHMNQGLIPNRFPDSGEDPEYNTVDATLWMFHAVGEYLRYTGDIEFVRTELFEALAESIAWHERGTHHGIRVDSDGLLTAGEPGVQLTWMDAKIGNWVVTPRIGKPVEIQALWYNALRVMERIASASGRTAQAANYGASAERARVSFSEAFWNDQDGCLYDVVTRSGLDRSIRPNQLFAIRLPYPLISGERARRILAVVERELLTPYGLRTLSPRDPNYRGRYAGDQRSRDSAYHQGTVWPWLLGPFVTAFVRTNGDNSQIRARAGLFLDALHVHLRKAGLGQISEVFDGDPPHNPGGCIAQAWSVAEVLRAHVEDVKDRKPQSAEGWDPH